MTAHPRIIGFGGTLSQSSTTLLALRRTLDEAQRHGATVELLEAGDPVLPMFEWGAEPNAAATVFADKFHQADALVWASPLYHGTVSGLFKNALDWLEILAERSPPYLTDKPVGLIGIAGGSHALQAITSMEQIVRSLRGWSVPLVVPINRASTVFDRATGLVVDATVDSQLTALGVEIVRAARIFSKRE